MVVTTDRRREGNLNPFALPSEARGRFRMLIAAALVFAWSAASYVVPAPVLEDQDFELSPRAQELYDKFIARDAEGVTLEKMQAVLELESMKRLLLIPFHQLMRIAVSALILIATVALALFLYRFHSRYLGFERKITLFSEKGAPTLAENLRRTILKNGISQRIRLAHMAGRIDELNGLAFGLRGRETLVLCGPLNVLEKAWSFMTRPIVLHELGHVVNGDVRDREMSRAIWVVLAVIVFGLVAAMAIGLDDVPPIPSSSGPIVLNYALSTTGEILLFVAKTAVFLGIIWWIWAELIRTQEFYADWRVVSWGQGETLLRLLGSPWRCVSWNGTPTSNVGVRQKVVSKTSFWRRLEKVRDRAIREYGLRHHPSRQKRIALLCDPRALFRVSPGLSFVTGLLFTTVLTNLDTIADDLVFLARLSAMGLYLLIGPWTLVTMAAIGLAAMLVLTYLIASALGVQVQREAIADLAFRPHGDWGYLRLVKTALVFALGLEAGLLLTPARFLQASVPPLYLLIWLGGFTCLTWMWLIYLHSMSRFLLGSKVGPIAPRWRQAALTGLSALLLAILYWPALLARRSLHAMTDADVMSSLRRFNAEETEAFVVLFVQSTIVLLAFALVIYVFVGLASMGGAAVWLGASRKSCPECGDKVPQLLVIGRRCGSCRNRLAPWAYLRSEREEQHRELA